MEKEMAKGSKDLIPTMPTLSKFPSLQKDESEIDADRFKQSLRVDNFTFCTPLTPTFATRFHSNELKELSSQLYHAADYSEKSFLKTRRKKILLENTKNYVCEVIVTVVDHLGTVSSNLEQRVYNNNKISQTEQRIDCLQQRFLTCQQYALSLDPTSPQWSFKLPRHHRHYALPSAARMPTFHANVIKNPSDTKVTAGANLAMVIPVEDDPSRLPKPSNTLFGSPTEDTFKLGSNDLKKRQTLQGSSNFLSFLRINKQKKNIDKSCSEKNGIPMLPSNLEESLYY